MAVSSFSENKIFTDRLRVPDYIENFRDDLSPSGRAKYHLGGRILALGNALMAVAEAVGRVTVSCLSSGALILTLGQFRPLRIFCNTQWNKTHIAISVFFRSCFAIISPKMLVPKPLTAIERECRMRQGDIPTRLKREFDYAQRQMNKQTDKPSFQYKEAPVHFEAVSHQKQVGAYSIGVCHAVGRRSTMEDQHLAEVFDITDASGQRHQAHLFAIFDGHNGAEVAEWVKNHLQSKIAGLLSNKVLDDETIWNVLKMAFVQLNKEIPEAICNQGTTATAALLLNGKIWTANVGDSRTVLENGGEALQLSEDAKPDDPRYKQSITHRDGVVIGHPARIDGVLAVARALGNHGLEGSVSARPKITQISLDQIRPGSQLVLACDGIYDVASTKQVVKSVYDNKSIPAGVLAKNIVYSAFAARSGDNLSVLVVRL